MPRCAWTNMVSERAVELSYPDLDWAGRVRGSRTVFVLPEHEPELRAHTDRRKRYLRVFYGLVGMLVLASVGTWLFAFAQGNALVLIAAGILLWILPFATPTVVETHGARASIRLARIAALVLAGMGTWLLLRPDP